MKIIYIGSFVDQDLEKSLNETNSTYTTSGTTFQRALLSGLSELGTELMLVNAPDVGSFPLRSKKLYFPSSVFKYHNLNVVNCAFINLTYFKQYSILHSLKKKLKEYCTKYKNEKIFLLVYSLVYPYIKAAIDIKKEFSNVHICPIVLDLPEFFNDKKNTIYDLLFNKTKFISKMYLNFDSAIILTKQMKDILKLNNKPYLVLEGIYNPENLPKEIVQKEKSILYTGKLDLRFGIDKLIEAFNQLKDTEYELWICGTGSMKDYVLDSCKKNNRIKYFGLLKQTDIFLLQKRASLLINPRQNIGEYTKYSFPSKTMEYLASGTPTIMYRLDGVPEEYYEYVIQPQNTSIKELVRILELWINKSPEELKKFGSKGKSYIINNKSSKKQAQQVIDFITNIYE